MKIERSDLAVLTGLFVLALILRLTHLLTILDAASFRYPIIDLAMYDGWARRIASGSLVGEAPFFLDPLYPYFVALIYDLVGPGPIGVGLVQSVLGALVPPLLYRATLRWFDRPTALLAGVIAALFLPSIYWSGFLMKPALTLFLVTMSLTLCSWALAGGPPRSWLLAGLTMTLAGLTRGNLLFVVPLLALWALFARYERRGGRLTPGRPDWLRAGAVIVGMIAVLVFPAAHNVAAGEFFLATANHGQIFYIGNNPGNPEGVFDALPFLDPKPQFEQRDFKIEAEARVGRPLTHRQVSRFWFSESRRWIAADPAAFLKTLAAKLRIYWGMYETPASLDYNRVRRKAPVLRLPLPGFAVVGPLALLGLLLALSRAGWPRMLALYAVAGTLSVAAFFVLTRFRMITAPALFVLAAHGAVELCRRLARVRRPGGVRPAMVALSILIAAVAFVDLPVRATEDRWFFRAAHALGLPTRLETTANGEFNAGVKFAAVARDVDDPAEGEKLLLAAEDELRRSLAQLPVFATRVELAKVLSRMGRNEESIALYRRAIVEQPRNYRLHHVLGRLLRRTGDEQGAEAAFRQALTVEPRHLASALQLGRLLMDAGRRQDATTVYRYALQLNPTNATALAGLEAAGADR